MRDNDLFPFLFQQSLRLRGISEEPDVTAIIPREFAPHSGLFQLVNPFFVRFFALEYSFGQK